jgi:hypothetical protein
MVCVESGDGVQALGVSLGGGGQCYLRVGAVSLVGFQFALRVGQCCNHQGFGVAQDCDQRAPAGGCLGMGASVWVICCGG